MSIAAEYVERREAWWRDWWAADYSWDGLAAAYSGWKIGANGELEPYSSENDSDASLRDIWEGVSLIPEWENGEIVRRWTRAHLPMRFASGAPAKLAWGPSDWAALDEDIEFIVRRLLSHPGLGQTDFLPLNGVILSAFPAQITEGPGFYFRQAAFVGDADIDPTLFEGVLDFGQCLFDGTLDLTDCSFARNVDFKEAVVCGSAWFHGVAFPADKSVSFQDAFLGAEASFRQARAEVLILSGVRVGHLHADKVSVKTSFPLGAASIAGSVSLAGASIGALWLYDCHIDGDFTAAGGKFERLRAEHATFSGKVDISKVEVSSEANFSGARFLKTLAAEKAKFGSELIFDSVSVADAVDFSRTLMGEQTQFRSAQFEAPVWFNDSVWPASEGSTQSCFLDATFKRLADFRSENPPSFSAFDGATLKAEARFSRGTFASDNRFRAQLEEAGSDAKMEALENGCRALKISAEAFGDRLGGQRFYRYEIMARRKRPSTPRAERLASYAYQLTSDFGMSFSRPLLALLLSWLLFAAIYLAFAESNPAGRKLHDAPVFALESSARAIFKPFGIWSVEPTDTRNHNPADLDAAMITYTAPRVALAYRALLTLQAIVSGILLFLFGLALKRRFQIS